MAAIGVVFVLVVGYMFFSGASVDRADLELLPGDSAFIVVADVDALMDTELFETAREMFGTEYNDMLAEMRKEVGFGPGDISQYLVGGTTKMRMPIMILYFKNDPDEERIKKLVESLRIRDATERDVNGHRVWGAQSGRAAVGRVRSGTIMIGPAADVDAALGSDDRAGPSKLIDLFVEEGGLDAQFAGIFDWRAPGAVPREVTDLVPGLANHIGPVLFTAEADEDTTASIRLFNTDGDSVARASIEVDGEFLEQLLEEVKRMTQRVRM